MEKKDEIIALNVNVSLLGYDSERNFIPHCAYLVAQWHLPSPKSRKLLSQNMHRLPKMRAGDKEFIFFLPVSSTPHPPHSPQQHK